MAAIFKARERDNTTVYNPQGGQKFSDVYIYINMCTYESLEKRAFVFQLN